MAHVDRGHRHPGLAQQKKATQGAASLISWCRLTETTTSHPATGPPPPPVGGRRWEFGEHVSPPPKPAGCAKPAVDSGEGELTTQAAGADSPPPPSPRVGREQAPRYPGLLLPHVWGA